MTLEDIYRQVAIQNYTKDGVRIGDGVQVVEGGAWVQTWQFITSWEIAGGNHLAPRNEWEANADLDDVERLAATPGRFALWSFGDLENPHLSDDVQELLRIVYPNFF